MKLNEVENEATELLGSDHIYLTRPSEPLPEDELKYILGSNLGLGGGSNLSWVYLRDKKNQNTGGGAFLLGAWQTRDLNEEVYDGDSICNLSSNQIMLDAGIYLCIIICPAYRVDHHQIRLYDLTASSMLLLGEIALSSTDTYIPTNSIIIGIAEVISSHVLEIQHKCNTTNSTNGFGYAGNLADEVYTQAIFVKIL